MTRHTAAEGRELSRRLAKMNENGGVPHAEIRHEMLVRIERDLRKLVRGYSGTARQAKQLLEALVIARVAGVTACDEIERELAERLFKPREA
jgi:hypothetical protein